MSEPKFMHGNHIVTTGMMERGVSLDNELGHLELAKAMAVRRHAEIRFKDGMVVTTNEPVELNDNGLIMLPTVDYSQVVTMEVEYEIEWSDNKFETVPNQRVPFVAVS